MILHHPSMRELLSRLELTFDLLSVSCLQFSIARRLHLCLRTCFSRRDRFAAVNITAPRTRHHRNPSQRNKHQ